MNMGVFSFSFQLNQSADPVRHSSQVFTHKVVVFVIRDVTPLTPEPGPNTSDVSAASTHVFLPKTCVLESGVTDKCIIQSEKTHELPVL